MKKVLIFLTLTLAILTCLVSCFGQTEHTHSFGEWSVTKNATCTEDGVKTRYCDCGEKQSGVITAIRHNYVDNVCSNCSDLKELPGCKHENVDILSAKEATCTESGLTEGIVCIDCGETIQYQNTVKALDHYLNNYTEKDENCKVLHITVCLRENCDYYTSKNTGTDEHIVAEWQLITNVPDGMSPCQINTDYFGVCVDCGATQTKSEIALGCIFNENSEVIIMYEPTMYSDGQIIVVCDRCHQGMEYIYLPILNGLDYNMTIIKTPTCVNDGTIEYTCYSYFGTFTFTSSLNALGHNYENNVCTKCGECSDKSYVRDGDYIYFGEYPQTIKADDVTITETQDDRGYYLGSDGSYYAKVTATTHGERDYYTFSTGATITNGVVYYFKVEPIRWRILSEGNEEALILCDSIIAGVPYQSDYAYDSSAGKTCTTANGAPEGTYATNYKYSEVRAWLNATFYETAFSSIQQAIILTTEVDNSVASTGYTRNPYVCENTNDKVFLLSYAEATNGAYGFSSNYHDDDTARRMLTSDYSRASGTDMSTSSTYYGNGFWWLRSPYDYPSGVREIGYTGSAYTSISGVGSVSGVVPALRISL